MSRLHLSKQYDQDLEAIKSKVLLMGGLAEQQFTHAVLALEQGNVALAEKVIAEDDQINQLQLSIDNACTELIMRRQPVAKDLRVVIATMRVITDIERIADEVTKIARSAKNLKTRNLLISNQYRPIYVIAKTAKRMLQQALDAYARLDGDLVIKMMALDDDVDQAFHEMMRSLITYMMEEPKTISASLDILWAAKAIERIGDHATNIGEAVVYMIKGDDIRHSDYVLKMLDMIR